MGGRVNWRGGGGVEKEWKDKKNGWGGEEWKGSRMSGVVG